MFRTTYEVNPRMNALRIQVERKGDKIYITGSFSIAE